MIFGGLSKTNTSDNYVVLNSNDLSIELAGELPIKKFEMKGAAMYLGKNTAMFVGQVAIH